MPESRWTNTEWKAWISNYFNIKLWDVITQQCPYINYGLPKPGIILGMGSANGRRCYMVTPSLIGRAHTQNDLRTVNHLFRAWMSRARLFSKSSLARLQEFWNSSICLYEMKKKNLSKSTCPTGSFTCPGPSGSGKWPALMSIRYPIENWILSFLSMC